MCVLLPLDYPQYKLWRKIDDLINLDLADSLHFWIHFNTLVKDRRSWILPHSNFLHFIGGSSVTKPVCALLPYYSFVKYVA